MAYISFQPSDYFETTLHTGTNGSGRTFTGLGFQPDFIWGKVRNSGNYNHMFVDSSRGGDKFLAQTTATEDTKSHGEITAWNSDGTTWADGTNATYSRLYYNDDGTQLGGSSYVWWQWKANGGTTSSNTDGGRTSTVQVNSTSKFSIGTFTSDGTVTTVGHGLGVTPDFFMFKTRSVTNGWYVYTTAIDGSLDFLNLGTTDTKSDSGLAAPTSTVLSVNSSVSGNSGSTCVFYAFKSVKGYSKVGTYTGNGSTNGTFVYTGFKPAFVMTKRTNAIGPWNIKDTKRPGYNDTDDSLFADQTAAEDVRSFDILSNGFKLRNSGTEMNGGGSTYLYIAFAEHPLVGSNGVPATAR